MGEAEAKSTCVPRIVIVGAGFAGLSAANELVESGVEAEITILEARDRVGGRCFSSNQVSRENIIAKADGADQQGGVIKDCDRIVLDYGAEFFSPDLHKRVAEIIQELGCQLEADASPSKFKCNVHRRGDDSSGKSPVGHSPYSFADSIDEALTEAEQDQLEVALNKMDRHIGLVSQGNMEVIKKLDISFHQYLSEFLDIEPIEGSPIYDILVSSLLTNFGVALNEISTLSILNTVIVDYDEDIWDLVYDDGPNFYRVNVGSGALAVRFAQTIKRKASASEAHFQIKFNTNVQSIDFGDNATSTKEAVKIKYSYVEETTSCELNCDYIILAVPLGAIRNITLRPEGVLPERYLEASKHKNGCKVQKLWCAVDGAPKEDLNGISRAGSGVIKTMYTRNEYMCCWSKPEDFPKDTSLAAATSLIRQKVGQPTAELNDVDFVDPTKLRVQQIAGHDWCSDPLAGNGVWIVPSPGWEAANPVNDKASFCGGRFMICGADFTGKDEGQGWVEGALVSGKRVGGTLRSRILSGRSSAAFHQNIISSCDESAEASLA